MSQILSQPVLIVGLGNPGERYEMTRHNCGFLVVQAFAKSLDWSLKKDLRFNAVVAKGNTQGRSVHLVLPLTFMNLSGTSVKRYMDYYKIPLENIIVVSDDISLPFGDLRLKRKGGAGGHNGLKSVESCLGSSEYMRLKIGIGQPDKFLADYVLETFNETERKELQVIVDHGSQLLQRLLKEDISLVMNNMHTVCHPTQKVPKQDANLIDLTKPPLTG